MEADDRLRVLPHWALLALRAMAEDMDELLEKVGHESPVLGPLREDEVGDAEP